MPNRTEDRGAVVLPHPTIALLRSASLATAAQQEIERLILGGELPPGAKLTEAALSERLASRAGRSARLSAASRRPAWCGRRRTAACSCATSPWTRRPRSTTCAR